MRRFRSQGVMESRLSTLRRESAPDPLRTQRRLCSVGGLTFEEMRFLTLRLSLLQYGLLAGLVGLAGCESRERSGAPEQVVTTINVEHGSGALPTVSFNVVLSSDGAAAIWRDDGDRVSKMSAGEIARGLTALGAKRNDQILIYAEHDPAHGDMLELVKSLRDQGFPSVTLVTPGGWVPPEPGSTKIDDRN